MFYRLIVIYFLSAILFGMKAFGEPSLTPNDFPNYCPQSYTNLPPTDSHTHQKLTYRDSGPRNELHGLKCEKVDVKTGEILGSWHLYFCEDINPNNYLESEFYIPLRPWFEFHPNFKRAEFMLFPKYTKFWRQKIDSGGTAYEWIGFNFMRNYTSQMQIEFLVPWVDGERSSFQKGAVSTAAVVFDQMKMAPLEDYFRCRVY